MPAIIVNWALGRFENYIADTFFDWPSYVISLVCWVVLVGVISILGRSDAPANDASTDPADVISERPAESDKPYSVIPSGSETEAPDRTQTIPQIADTDEDAQAADFRLSQLQTELYELESEMETLRKGYRNATETLDRLAEDPEKVMLNGTSAAFVCYLAGNSIQEFSQKFPKMETKRARVAALIVEIQGQCP